MNDWDSIQAGVKKHVEEEGCHEKVQNGAAQQKILWG